MQTFQFWHRWLFIAALCICAFGVMLALFNSTILFKAFNRQIDAVFWPGGISPQDTKTFQQWIYGVLGATVAGWGMFLAFLARYPFRNREKWAWNCIMSGLVVWFLIDTPVSFYYKVYFNVIFNIMTFIAVLLPLFFSKKYFETR